jgi:hypothetical protein
MPDIQAGNLQELLLDVFRGPPWQNNLIPEILFAEHFVKNSLQIMPLPLVGVEKETTIR